MYNTIIIDITSNSKYALVMTSNEIVDFLYPPSDYTVEDFIVFIKNSGYLDNGVSTAYYDNRGEGKQIEELISNKYPRLDIDFRPLPCINHQKSTLILIAKEQVVDYGARSNFDLSKLVEFRKLYDEIDNLDVSMKSNNMLVMVKKDETIGDQRATCFLNGLYILNKGKQK